MMIVWSKVVLLAVAFVMINTRNVQANRRYHEKQLIKSLLADYDSLVRPSPPGDASTVVNIGFVLWNILEFDAKTSHLSVAGAFGFYWTDPDLQWNISDHHNISRLVSIKRSRLWTPTLTLKDPYHEIHHIGYGSSHEDDRLTVNHNGSILWFPGAILDVVCQANITYFPFDTQRCEFNLYNYYVESVTFEILENPYVRSFFTESALWDLVSITIDKKNDEFGYFIQLDMVMKRRPLFYVMNVIAPINCIVLLNIFVFLMPVDSGERIGFSVTMLLSMAVFLTIVSDRLPESSDTSILGFILFLEFAMSGCILICVIISINCYFKTSHVPKCIQRCFCRKKTHKCTEDKNNTRSVHLENSNTYCPGQSLDFRHLNATSTWKFNKHTQDIESEKSYSDTEKKTSHVGEYNQFKNSNNKSQNEIPIQWTDVSRKLDTIFFLVFFILFVGNVVIHLVLFILV